MPVPVITRPFENAVLQRDRLKVDKQNFQRGVGFVRSVGEVAMCPSCDPEGTGEAISVC